MGPENKESGYAIYLDGVPVMPGKIEEIALTAEVQEPGDILLWQPRDLTAQIKIPKRRHCTNRKRFIKLIMSKGYGRNYAAYIAEQARRAGIPYQEAWQTFFFWE